MDNIFPDLSQSQFDVKYARRLVLPSDLIMTKPPGATFTQAGGREVEVSDPVADIPLDFRNGLNVINGVVRLGGTLEQDTLINLDYYNLDFKAPNFIDGDNLFSIRPDHVEGNWNDGYISSFWLGGTELYYTTNNGTFESTTNRLTAEFFHFMSDWNNAGTYHTAYMLGRSKDLEAVLGYNVYNVYNRGVRVGPDDIIIGGVNAAGNPNAMEFTGIRVFGTGDIQLHSYPSTRNDGAATSALYVDANGNLKLGSIATPPSYTYNNGLTLSTGNVQLGGNLIHNTNIELGGYDFQLHDLQADADTKFYMNSYSFWYQRSSNTSGGKMYFYHDSPANRSDFYVSVESSLRVSEIGMNVNGDYGSIWLVTNGSWISLASGAIALNGNSSKGITINTAFGTEGNITFEAYPNTRNDGSTTSALYVDASGNLKHGLIGLGNAGQNGGNFIWNQYTSAQTAQGWINGMMRAGSIYSDGGATFNATVNIATSNGYELNFTGTLGANIYASNSNMHLLAGGTNLVHIGGQEVNSQVKIGGTAYTLDVAGTGRFSSTLEARNTFLLYDTADTTYNIKAYTSTNGESYIQFTKPFGGWYVGGRDYLNITTPNGGPILIKPNPSATRTDSLNVTSDGTTFTNGYYAADHSAMTWKNTFNTYGDGTIMRLRSDGVLFLAALTTVPNVTSVTGGMYYDTTAARWKGSYDGTAWKKFLMEGDVLTMSAQNGLNTTNGPVELGGTLQRSTFIGTQGGGGATNYDFGIITFGVSGGFYATNFSTAESGFRIYSGTNGSQGRYGLRIGAFNYNGTYTASLLPSQSAGLNGFAYAGYGNGLWTYSTKQSDQYNAGKDIWGVYSVVEVTAENAGVTPAAWTSIYAGYFKATKAGTAAGTPYAIYSDGGQNYFKDNTLIGTTTALAFAGRLSVLADSSGAAHGIVAGSNSTGVWSMIGLGASSGVLVGIGGGSAIGFSIAVQDSATYANKFYVTNTGSIFSANIANATTDPDKILVSDAGVLKYMTKAQLGIGASNLAMPTNQVVFGTGTGVATNNLFQVAFMAGNGSGSTSTAGHIMQFGSTATTAIGSNYTTLALDGSVGSGLTLSSNGSRTGVVMADATDLSIANVRATGKIKLQVNGTEKATLLSDGKFLVGYTASQGTYLMQVNGTTLSGGHWLANSTYGNGAYGNAQLGGLYLGSNYSGELVLLSLKVGAPLYITNGGNTSGAMVIIGTANDNAKVMSVYDGRLRIGSANTVETGMGLQVSYGNVKVDSMNDNTNVAKMVTVTNGVFGYQAIPSGGSGTDTNFTTADLTMTANRTHSIGTFNLAYTGTGNIMFGHGTSTSSSYHTQVSNGLIVTGADGVYFNLSGSARTTFNWSATGTYYDFGKNDYSFIVYSGTSDASKFYGGFGTTEVNYENSAAGGTRAYVRLNNTGAHFMCNNTGLSGDNAGMHISNVGIVTFDKKSIMASIRFGYYQSSGTGGVSVQDTYYKYYELVTITASANLGVTLPSASAMQGQELIIMNYNTNATYNYSWSGVYKVDGTAVTLDRGKSYTIVSNGVNWIVTSII